MRKNHLYSIAIMCFAFSGLLVTYNATPTSAVSPTVTNPTTPSLIDRLLEPVVTLFQPAQTDVQPPEIPGLQVPIEVSVDRQAQATLAQTSPPTTATPQQTSEFEQDNTSVLQQNEESDANILGQAPGDARIGEKSRIAYLSTISRIQASRTKPADYTTSTLLSANQAEYTLYAASGALIAGAGMSLVGGYRKNSLRKLYA